ncbi:MAG: hypothetical protein R3B40_29075 [Polyangiales bacterium]|nr:hypothetical protein [Myxococcales bacterium]MCB9658598.1 hypothetical protein [Sandaracinaceae bacterium]
MAAPVGGVCDAPGGGTTGATGAGGGGAVGASDEQAAVMTSITADKL